MTTPNDTISRTCSKCGEEFPRTTDYFHRSKTCRDGLNTVCKQCVLKKVTAWQSANPDKVKLAKRKSADKHKAKSNARAKERYKTDESFRSVHNKRTSSWAKRNRDRVNANHRRLRQQPKYKMRGRLERQRRHRNTFITESQIVAIWEELQGRCAYCGISIFLDMEKDVTIEHIIPITRGGTGDLSNITLVCLSCNTSKGDKLYDEWKQVRGW